MDKPGASESPDWTLQTWGETKGLKNVNDCLPDRYSENSTVNHMDLSAY